MRIILMILTLLSLPSMALAGAARPGGDKAVTNEESTILGADKGYMVFTLIPSDPVKEKAHEADKQKFQDLWVQATIARTRTEYLGKLADYRELRDSVCAAYNNKCAAYPAR